MRLPLRRVPVSVTAAALLAATLPLLAPAPASAHGHAAEVVVETRVLGRSVEGRPITAYRKGNPSAPLEVVVVGQTHGNERAGVVTAEQLRRSTPVSTRADVWVIPTINPDGHAAGRRTNARGVDLNRNWPAASWASTGAGTVYYSGPAAASEPETQALLRFLDEVDPRFVATIHQPLAAVGTSAKDPDYSRRLGAELRLPVGPLRTCTGTECGPNTSAATLNAWFNPSHDGTAVTIEYPSSPGSSYARAAAEAILRASYADAAAPRIAQRYEETGGAPASVLGRPLTPELVTPDRVGRYTHYAAGSIYWTPTTDARVVRGAIRDRWAALGWETSVLGYPVTDELPTPGRRGAYSHFQRGSVYWSPSTGAHEVYGAIRDRWASLGWEAGRLGFPTRGEHDVPGGRRSTFQGGSITWDRATGATAVRYVG